MPAAVPACRAPACRAPSGRAASGRAASGRADPPQTHQATPPAQLEPANAGFGREPRTITRSLSLCRVRTRGSSAAGQLGDRDGAGQAAGQLGDGAASAALAGLDPPQTHPATLPARLEPANAGFGREPRTITRSLSLCRVRTRGSSATGQATGQLGAGPGGRPGQDTGQLGDGSGGRAGQDPRVARRGGSGAGTGDRAPTGLSDDRAAAA